MSTHYFFRDQLTIDDSLPDQLAALGTTPGSGDTMVLGAAACQLNSLPAGWDYLIMADSLSTAPVVPMAVATGRSVSIYAQTITTALEVNAPGNHGAAGTRGKAGLDGEHVILDGKPHILPGGDGGAGGPGSPGGAGGTVVISYASAAIPPTASAPGGAGGAGGVGGTGGSGVPPGRNGPAGRSGLAGADGSITISVVPSDEVYSGLPALATSQWAQYRTEVGTYLFRLFDPASQLHALAEFDAALLLDPANTTAATMRKRVVAQETPSGISRDLDISPDYKDISAGLLGETQLVLAEFLALQETSTEDEIAAATKDQLQLSVGQLADRLTEAQLDLVSADDGVQIANSERSMYDAQWASLQQQIFALQDQPLSLGDLLTTLGAVAGAIAGLATGVGAIVSIPGALAAADNPQSGLSEVLGFLLTGHQFWNDKSLGGDMTDLLKGGQDAVTNFAKVYDELSGSTADATITQLALQQATVAMQEMVAQLRQQQAADQVVAAQTRVSDLTAEVAATQSLLGTWAQTEAFIDAVLGQLLTIARALADMVSEDVFLARRALEIYQLADASDVRFDYGYLHPDADYDLAGQPLQRVLACLESLATLPADVITWDQIFVALNEAQSSGYDVVHPVIEVVIDDPVALNKLRSGDGLLFSVGIGPNPVAATIPSDIYELKVDNLQLELSGATAAGTALVWAQHNGHWVMKRPPTADLPDPLDIEFSLFSHVEAFNLAAGQDPGAVIPAQPQNSADPGPPFSFWGRGALADWTLFVDPFSAAALDLTGLSQVRLSIGCIGLVVQGTVTPSTVQVAPLVTGVPGGAQRSAVRDGVPGR
jgi:hypothetical protein